MIYKKTAVAVTLTGKKGCRAGASRGYTDGIIKCETVVKEFVQNAGGLLRVRFSCFHPLFLD